MMTSSSVAKVKLACPYCHVSDTPKADGTCANCRSDLSLLSQLENIKLRLLSEDIRPSIESNRRDKLTKVFLILILLVSIFVAGRLSILLWNESNRSGQTERLPLMLTALNSSGQFMQQQIRLVRC